MTKTYASSTQVSVFIGSLLVQFLAHSNGGSTYSTDIKYIQDGLEKAPGFGSLYRLVKTEGEEEHVNVVAEQKPVVDNTPELEKVEVSCLDDAKDYLEENFGVDRTTLRSKSTVKSVAKKNGIEFVGI